MKPFLMEKTIWKIRLIDDSKTQRALTCFLPSLEQQHWPEVLEPAEFFLGDGFVFKCEIVGVYSSFVLFLLPSMTK